MKFSLTSHHSFITICHILLYYIHAYIYYIYTICSTQYFFFSAYMLNDFGKKLKFIHAMMSLYTIMSKNNNDHMMYYEKGQ